MITIKPFRGLRPPRELVEQVESRPYDVLDSEEARAEAGNNEKSLYHIIKPEIDFPVGTSEYDPRVYEQAARNVQKFQDEGWLVQDAEPHYYIYAQSMKTERSIWNPEQIVKTQYGIVLAASVDDYMEGRIKKHELTRRDKEEDRMKHVRVCNANMEPVFFAYPDNAVLDALIMRYAQTEPEYDFIAPVDGFRHQFWVIDSEQDMQTITAEFAKMESLYIADGHHRSAAAALVGAEKQRQNPNHTGQEEYNYFMAVCFQASQLTILGYNRLLKDLNGLTPREFIGRLAEHFDIYYHGNSKTMRPTSSHYFTLYMDGQWHSLFTKRGHYDQWDPIGSLDVDISSRLIFDNILGIKDLRTTDRIEFVGGLRGLDYLAERVDSGEMAAALVLYPVTMKQIMAVADSGKIMPPKATWFEPKLRSGLVVHKLS